MKTVIIPNDYHPFVIEVNGVKYTYPEGTEQSVPDEVASAIENYYKLQPREGDPNPVPFGVDADGKEEYKSKYTGAEIDAAVAKAGDATKVEANPTLAGTEAALEGLQVGDTKYKVGGGGSDVFKIKFTMSNIFANTATCDKSFAEIEAAVTAGSQLEFILVIGTTIVAHKYEYLRIDNGDDTYLYNVVFQAYFMGNFKCYMPDLKSDDTVTLTKFDLTIAS